MDLALRYEVTATDTSGGLRTFNYENIGQAIYRRQTFLTTRNIGGNVIINVYYDGHVIDASVTAITEDTVRVYGRPA